MFFLKDYLNEHTAQEIIAYIDSNLNAFYRNFEIYTDFMTDAYWYDFSKNPQHLKMLEVFKILAGRVVSANDFNYKPDKKFEELTKRFKELEKLFKQNLPTTKKEAEKLQDVAKSIMKDIQHYFQRTIPNTEGIRDILISKKMLSPRQQLKEQMKQHDKRYPLRKKYLVKEHDEDGFDIEGTSRLETDEEVETRVKRVLERRNNYLTAASSKNEQRTLFNTFLNFLNQVVGITNLNDRTGEILKKLSEFISAKELRTFTSDKAFYDELLKIMEHSKEDCLYWYHGTQSVEDALSINKLGLAMQEKSLSSTAYREFSPEQLLMYHRGWAGEIGEDAIVIIKQPKDKDADREDPDYHCNAYKNIVEKIGKRKIPFNPSCIGRISGEAAYFVPPEYIVGVVDKRNHKIIYGQAYEDVHTDGFTV